jgi:WD40 repeat protein
VTLRNIIIFDVITGSQIATLSGHNSCVQSLAFSSDGILLVSGSSDKTIKLWDIQTGGVVKTLSGHTDSVLCVSISADNTMIASSSYDKTIRLWNIKTGDCHIIETHEAIYCHC